MKEKEDSQEVQGKLVKSLVLEKKIICEIGCTKNVKTHKKLRKLCILQIYTWCVGWIAVPLLNCQN